MQNMTIESVISELPNVSNINKLLPSRSKHPDVVRIRDEINTRTAFLHPNADLRERLWYIEHNATTPPLCETCGKVGTTWDYTGKRFRQYCSPTCVGLSTQVGSKKALTNIQQRGVEFPAQSQDVKQRYNATMMKRYGAPFINQSDVVKSGSMVLLNDKEYINDLTHNQNMSTFDIGNHLGVSQSTASRYRAKHGIPPRPSTVSSVQREVQEFVERSSAVPIITNTRSVIPPLELDIYVPSHNLAIEVNGLYWHSELSGGKGPNYHLTKTMMAASQQITLMHVFDSDWKLRRNAVESRILSALGLNKTVGARHCYVDVVDRSTAAVFFDTNHTQGHVNGSVYYGLYFDGGLVACASFGKSRYGNYQWELLRFCSTKGITIAGGGSKLVAHFRTNHNPITLVSYCDLRWGRGGAYSKMGFALSHRSKPNYWYFTPGDYKLKSRVAFQKHKLSSILSAYDSNLTEWDNMVRNGYDRVWDCGNDVWVLSTHSCNFTSPLKYDV